MHARSPFLIAVEAAVTITTGLYTPSASECVDALATHRNK